MEILIWAIIWVAMGFVCSHIARLKNRDTTGWFLGGFFLGLIGLIIIALLKPLEKKEQH